ncbi:MAG: aquaporin family protein [Eubacteriaceae bacterium]|nr:aquaporin family protein [Eubacteriaceae bacterium]
MITKAIGEFVGTMILIYIGDGVVANNILDDNNAKGLGVLAIDIAWGVAVAIPAYIFMGVSGSFFNPAIVIAYMLRGTMPLSSALVYIPSEILGAFAGSALMYLTFLDQFKGTSDKGLKLNAFTTRPAKKHYFANFLTEFIGTSFLVFGVYEIVDLPSPYILKGCMIGALVFGLAVCMGGPTGASLNQARDLGPRLAHWILPVYEKGSSEWSYGWCPVLAQTCAAFAAFGFYTLIHAL